MKKGVQFCFLNQYYAVLKPIHFCLNKRRKKKQKKKKKKINCHQIFFLKVDVTVNLIFNHIV